MGPVRTDRPLGDLLGPCNPGEPGGVPAALGGVEQKRNTVDG